jgi:hypothetical protein
VHGFAVVPEYNFVEQFAGGIAFYTLGFKPDQESPWSFTWTAGADRAAITPAGALEASREWRGLVSANVFYTFSPSFTVGVENTFFLHPEINEYLILPHINWRPVERFFVQAGIGYYDVAHDGQATFMLRANVLQPSPRRAQSRISK